MQVYRRYLLFMITVVLSALICTVLSNTFFERKVSATPISDEKKENVEGYDYQRSFNDRLSMLEQSISNTQKKLTEGMVRAKDVAMVTKYNGLREEIYKKYINRMRGKSGSSYAELDSALKDELQHLEKQINSELQSKMNSSK